MEFEVVVDQPGDYLRITVAGPTSLANFSVLIESIAAQIQRHGCGRVLVDLRKVQGRLPTIEQQRIGELAAAGLPTATSKVASVVPEGEISRNSEAAALRSGLLLRVFDSEAGALFWLLEGESSTAGNGCGGRGIRSA
jgi:hypothetical protein